MGQAHADAERLRIALSQSGVLPVHTPNVPIPVDEGLEEDADDDVAPASKSKRKKKKNKPPPGSYREPSPISESRLGFQVDKHGCVQPFPTDVRLFPKRRAGPPSRESFHAYLQQLFEVGMSTITGTNPDFRRLGQFHQDSRRVHETTSVAVDGHSELV